MNDLKTFLETHTLCEGVGELDEKGNGECCSISALNWCAGRGCNDDIAPEDSAVIGRWVIAMQDCITSEQRNSERWKNLLLRLPGLGQEPESEQRRLSVAMDAMWERLASLQPLADRFGFGAQWQTMCKEKTSPAAYAAADEAYTASYAAERVGDDAVRAAAEAVRAAYEAARAVADAVREPYEAYEVDEVDEAAVPAARSAGAAWATERAARAASYADFDPYTILERMIES